MLNLKNLIRKLLLVILVTGPGLMHSTYSHAISTNTRVTYPSAIVIELGGRALLYSFNFDRVLTENVSFGLGIGTVQTERANGDSANTTATVIPVYITYYISRDAGSFFATAGANLIANSGSVQDLKTSPAGLELNNSPLQATFGVGYELRSDTGFLVRAAGYGIIASNFAPWAGASVGYSF